MKNQNDLDKFLEKLIVKSESAIDKIYAKRLKQILGEITMMYEKYEVDGALTMAEMSKYGRLAKSMEFIIGELVGTYKESYKLIQTTMEEQYLEAYFRLAYLTEFEAQQSLGFGAISKEVLAASLANPVEFLTLSAIMERNRAQVIYKIQQEITEGLIAGESYAKMAKRLRDRLGIDRRKSQLVARTEAGRAQSVAKEDAYQQAKKKADVQKVWDAALDSRTRKTHQKLDGQKADKDGYFHLGNAKAVGPRLWGIAKEDIQCRCAVRMEVNGRQPEVRRARLEDGSTKVIPHMSFEDWKKSEIGQYVK
jgi:SPP1 gp7 family putative phage head morphogenesis protein